MSVTKDEIGIPQWQEPPADPVSKPQYSQYGWPPSFRNLCHRCTVAILLSLVPSEKLPRTTL